MKNLPLVSREFIDSQDFFLLFETGMTDPDNYMSYIFGSPLAFIKVYGYDEVGSAFDKIEEYSKKHYLAGYFSYELGYAFEPGKFRMPSGSDYPLINLCVFDMPAAFNHRTGEISGGVPGLFDERSAGKGYSVKNLRFDLNRDIYDGKIKKIKEYIKKGDTYQVNFTGKYRFDFSGSRYDFYLDLKNKQSVSYGAFCKLGDECVISLSPELFFRKKGLRICSKPMKGTISRGKTNPEDRGNVLRLRKSRKNLAENLMIVDMVRNDLGRISETGSVKTGRLFNIERYDTIFQMTSEVKGRLRKETAFIDIFKNIFPGGSVTGAPKVRTMQIIKQLERYPRNVYCGALGFISPGGDAVFNLPIRTISIKKTKGEMGVGGGIVYDSDAGSEYKECVLKAGFLLDKHHEFELIETLLWDKDYIFLKEHLKRLNESARYFGFRCDCSKICRGLKNAASSFSGGICYRVRLQLNKRGDAEISHSALDGNKPEGKMTAVISAKRTDPGDKFLYHKTTSRKVYDSEYKKYSSKGFFDAVFLNKNGEVTEGSISNIIIKKGGFFYTPPVSSGLLPGIFRNYYLRNDNVKEKILFLEDLEKADKIFLCNSVRGLTEAVLKR